MRIVALMTVRNEAAYLARSLEHLAEQGVSVVLIDNDSEDATADIARRFLGCGVERIVRQPFHGHFDLVAQLRLQEALAQECAADWFIHHDADEIIEAPPGRGSLVNAIADVDRLGFDAINCDEFVFVPTAEDDAFEGRDYVAGMQHYYFFEPRPQRLVRMWRKGAPVELASSGGHVAEFAGRRLFPEPFVLRHYIGLSARYLREKYARRVYSRREIAERGWHGWRGEFEKWTIALPGAGALKRHVPGEPWDRSDPKLEHQFLARRRH